MLSQLARWTHYRRLGAFERMTGHWPQRRRATARIAAACA
jgi:hypothetical protein